MTDLAPKATFSGLGDLLHPEQASRISSMHDPRPTGFNAIDSILAGGLAPEELVVIGGRPGVGKSITLVQWARNLAHAGRDVVLACYEHSELIVMAQLLLVEIGESVSNPVESLGPRNAVDRLIARQSTWAETVGSNEILEHAAEQLSKIADRLTILGGNGRVGGFDVIENAVLERSPDVLMVDHLQRVDGDAGHAAERLKQLAVDTSATVVATATTSNEGISGLRLRQSGLVDASVIGHESDIEILLNDKVSIVSRNHSAFDSVRAEHYRSQVVFSIEKNRRGKGDVDLEFTRDFSHRRFHTVGEFVTERLVDGVLVRE